jgi:hypothetical protein
MKSNCKIGQSSSWTVAPAEEEEEEEEEEDFYNASTAYSFFI